LEQRGWNFSSPRKLKGHTTVMFASKRVTEKAPGEGQPEQGPDSLERPRPVRCMVVIGTLGRGGAERQALLTVAGLRSAGHVAWLHVVEPPLLQADDAMRLGVEFEPPPQRSGIAAQIARLRRTVQERRPDGVITFLASSSLRYMFASLRGWSTCAPVWLLTERGNTTLHRVRAAPARTLMRTACLQRADRVVVNSPSLAANMISFVNSVSQKIEVVPNALPTFDTRAAEARSAVMSLVGREDRFPVLGMVGSFQADRNHDLLLEAFRVIVTTHPRAQLLVVGRTTGFDCAPVAERFRRRAETLGLRDQVTMTGEIPDARNLISGLDAFVLSSKLEGSSNALAEALVAGSIIATTPVADAEVLLAGAGVVSSGWTPEALARAILEALARPAYWRDRSMLRGRDLLVERGLAPVGNAWARIIREAIDSRTLLRRAASK
jgi:glycosyltransferase involved in cell wall biosynthesis